MKTFREELSKFEAEQRELANAEKLFDLPITQYPELLACQKEMRAFEQIYAIYEEQKVCQLSALCRSCEKILCNDRTINRFSAFCYNFVISSNAALSLCRAWSLVVCMSKLHV